LNKDLDKLVVDVVRSMGNPKLQDLIERLVKDEGLKFKDAAKHVYLLWKDGTVDLSETRKSKTFFGYALSLESLWFWAVTTLVALTVPIVFYAVVPPLLYLRYVLGSFFTLYLPGAMLVEALYPRGEDLESLERFALSIGLSLAVVPLIGLLLNYLPWGIRLTPVTLSLAIFAEAMAAVALARKYRYYVLSLGK